MNNIPDDDPLKKALVKASFAYYAEHGLTETLLQLAMAIGATCMTETSMEKAENNADT